MVRGLRPSIALALLASCAAPRSSEQRPPRPPAAPVVVDVLAFYGAGSHPGLDAEADTNALQAAFDRAAGRHGETPIAEIVIPRGRFRIRRTLELANVAGYVIRGLGAGSTILAPTIELGRSPVLRLTNLRYSSVRDLRIDGNGDNPPTAAIESVSDVHAISKCPANPLGGIAPGVPVGLTLRDLVLGTIEFGVSDERPVFDHAIAFRAEADSDGNNDHSSIENVYIGRFRCAGIHIGHSNSLNHRIVNGMILSTSGPDVAVCQGLPPAGVLVHGGSFNMIGTTMAVHSPAAYDFYFAAPVGTLGGKSSAGYYHPSTIDGVDSESLSNVLKTDAWPTSGTPVSDGQLGISIYLSHYLKKGADPKGNVAIDYDSRGELFVSESHFVFGAPKKPVIFRFGRSDSVVTLTTSSFRGLTVIEGAANVTSFGNVYHAPINSLRANDISIGDRFLP